MEQHKAVIGRPSNVEKLENGLKSYLSAARADPTLPLNIRAILRAIGERKSTLYLHQHEPKVALQLDLIRSLAIARKKARNLDDADDAREPDDLDQPIQSTGLPRGEEEARPIDLEVLAVRTAGAVQKAVWSMNRFIGHHRKHRHVSDLPRVVYDIDKTLAELRLVRGDLGALCDEWRQIAKDETVDHEAEGQLSLPTLREKQ